MVKLATKRPIAEDDIPDFTEEQLALFYRIREKNTEIKQIGIKRWLEYCSSAGALSKESPNNAENKAF